jgi:hypothetical protein
MKTLQNNFTTPEQSKRLLELGVPADSADCYYDVLYDNDGYFWRNENHPTIVINDYEYDTDGNEFILPCWSVGRMIEIVKICASYELTIEIYGRAILYCDIINGIISEMAYEIGSIDFSKLD